VRSGRAWGMTMPGLPKTPSAAAIDIDAEGKVVDLF
jgi:formyltetrahydrofolate synthetase